jgi:hypothetical protein
LPFLSKPKSIPNNGTSAKIFKGVIKNPRNGTAAYIYGPELSKEKAIARRKANP